MKKLGALLLSVLMMFSLVACSTEQGAGLDKKEGDDKKVVETDTETVTDEDWKKEEAYGKELTYFYDGGNCTSAPYFADKLGYFEDAGVNMKGFVSPSYTEALGTNAAQLAVGHISTLLVPSTNGVDLSFVGGAHIACKTLYVLADSDYSSTEDLKGKKISAPNGIGASDYNILARFFDKDGINPMEEVDLVQVETSACVTSMQNGEIAGALLSDTFAYDMVQDGVLKPVRSLSDDDFRGEPCCVMAMNTTFIRENPITANKITQAMKDASKWMRENPEEAVKMLLDDDQIGGDYDMNVELWKDLEFGLEDDFTEKGLNEIAKDYIRLGLISAMEDDKDVMNKVWTPMAPEK